jgi:hypothetical protein
LLIGAARHLLEMLRHREMRAACDRIAGTIRKVPLLSFAALVIFQIVAAHRVVPSQRNRNCPDQALRLRGLTYNTVSTRGIDVE